MGFLAAGGVGSGSEPGGGGGGSGLFMGDVGCEFGEGRLGEGYPRQLVKLQTKAIPPKLI